jgi:hypothetical protein
LIVLGHQGWAAQYCRIQVAGTPAAMDSPNVAIRQQQSGIQPLNADTKRHSFPTFGDLGEFLTVLQETLNVRNH